MKLNKKGFSLVELLAVIVILGLLMTFAIPNVSRLISKSKNENIDSHKKTLIMAAESYLQDNKDELPKAIGDRVIIKAQTLRDANYLKEDIYNADKKSCMRDSVVRVYKYDTKDYSYTAHIYCEGDKVPSDIEGIKPEINITFTDKKGNPYNISKDNVTTAVTKIEIAGGKGDEGDIALDGYSYIISAQYDNKDKPVEIYNSGSVNARGKKKISINKDITDFIDRTRLSYIIVTVEAYNHDGGHTKKTADSRYQDSKKPVCGETTGEPAENEWNKDWRTKRITIKCSDGDGSGCVKGSFTKTFTKEAEYGTITIKDNAGNTTDCTVRVHLDWTRPTLTINAYKRLASGSKGTKVGSVTVNNSNHTLDLNKYLDTFPNSNQVVSTGTGNWMNKAKYPYGIYYEVITEDNIKLGKGTWSENATKLQKNDSKVTTVTAQSSKGTKEFTKGDNKTSFSLVDEGYRYGIYELKDKALNTVTIKITAPIDRTNPTVPTVSLYKKNSGTDISSSSGLGGYTNNSWLSGHVFTEASKSTDAISLFDHYEFTTTGKTTNESNKKQPYRNINAEGTSHIKYRACDKAGNCSNYTGNSTIKLDRTAPACNNGTGGYRSGTWTNRTVYTSASCSESGDVSGCNGVIKLSTSGAVGNRTKHVLSSLPVSQQGSSYTTYYTYDRAGNERACATVNELLDLTPPTMSWSHGSGTYNSNSGISVSINCYDSGGSGLATYGKTQGIGSPRAGVGVSYTCRDNAGNSVSGRRTYTTKYYSAHSSCGSYNCNPYNCNPYECNCHEEWYQKNYNGPCRYAGDKRCYEISCADKMNPVYCCNCPKRVCSTCYQTCYHTCYYECWHG